MGPKRFDAIEGLKAQAVAARTYAMAHRGQFEAEGYDLCPGPEVPGLRRRLRRGPALDRGGRRHARPRARVPGTVRRRALRLDLRRRDRERRERVFRRAGAVPRLGPLRRAARPRSSWRERAARAPSPDAARRSSGAATCCAGTRRRRPAPRAASLETAQRWAGVPRQGAPPAKLSPAAVYPSLVADFDLTEARAAAPDRRRTSATTPSARPRWRGLSGPARERVRVLPALPLRRRR